MSTTNEQPDLQVTQSNQSAAEDLNDHSANIDTTVTGSTTADASVQDVVAQLRRNRLLDDDGGEMSTFDAPHPVVESATSLTSHQREQTGVNAMDTIRTELAMPRGGPVRLSPPANTRSTLGSEVFRYLSHLRNLRNWSLPIFEIETLSTDYVSEHTARSTD